MVLNREHFSWQQRRLHFLGTNLPIRMLRSQNQPIPMAILFMFLLQFSLYVSSTSLDQNNGGRVQREFDYFALALQWPGTVCRGTRHCCSSNACCNKSGAFADFTIHGLWPDYNDGTWPSCCTGKRFDEKEIHTLLDPLNKYWSSMSCSSPSTCHGGKGSFWAHEWEKHGTCSSPVTRDEYSYFLTTLNVYFKYNVTKVINDAGYVPSNTEKYPLGGIISAIQNAFHATPQLVCSKGAVEELRLCFYKDFKPRDCVQNSKSSCPKYVSLPAYEPGGKIFEFADSSKHPSA